MYDRDPSRAWTFRFSIRRTLPRAMTAREVIAVEQDCVEQDCKDKLGIRAFGLNLN